MELLWEIAGWAGAVAILSAYLSVSMGWLKAGKGFQIANLFGSVAFIINGSVHGAWPSVVTNVAWFLISAIALVRMRATAPAVVPVEPQVQYPGVPDTTGQMAVVEVLTGSIPVVAARPAAACSAPARGSVHTVDGQRLAV